MHRQVVEGATPTLADRLRVARSKGNGVVAGVQIGRDIPNEGTPWRAYESEDEVNRQRRTWWPRLRFLRNCGQS